MISTCKNFVFIHIPKTGGSSIEQCLKEYSSDPVIESNNNIYIQCCNINNICSYYKHASLQQHIDIHGDVINNYLPFTVTRNPWERLISLWFWQDGNFNKKQFIQKIKTQINVPVGESAWAPMANYIYNDDNTLVNNNIKIIRFENLKDDFESVLNLLNIQKNLPHINKSSHKHYSEYYDDETKAIVDHYYKRDIELFGYTFNRKIT